MNTAEEEQILYFNRNSEAGEKRYEPVFTDIV